MWIKAAEIGYALTQGVRAYDKNFTVPQAGRASLDTGRPCASDRHSSSNHQCTV